MLAWFGWLWFTPGPSPYRYQLAEEGDVPKFPKLGLEAWPDLTISRYEIYTEGIGQPLASGHAARRGRVHPCCLTGKTAPANSSSPRTASSPN